MKKIYFLFITLVSIGFHLKAQTTIAAWDFTSESSPATSSADLWNNNLDGSNLVTRGSGASSSSAANSFRTQGFQNNGIQLSNNDYFEHTLSASSGFTLSLSSIDARFAGTNTFFATPGVTMQFAYSLDGTNFTLIGTPFIMTSQGAMPTINLTSITELQNIPENTTVTIRFYASGQTTTGGWGYYSQSAGTYGISFGGSLNCNVQTTYYADLDNDTFGDANSFVLACQAPIGYVSNSLDCNDNNAAINPNSIWYIDSDGDLYGDPTFSQTGCIQPTGYVLNSNDCDDNNNQIHPGAVDIILNGIDEDCNGSDALLLPTMLGMYEFTQLSACPVTATSVSVQPSSATFSNFSNTGGACVAASNVFNNNNWNTTSTVNLSNYNEFSIQANSCYDLALTKLTFSHKVSNINTIPVWHLRSNLDNFTTDIASDSIRTTSIFNDTVNLGGQFQNINQVTYRFYITGVSTLNATWRMDNVSLYGIISSISPQVFYADFDGDGFGDLNSDTLTCTMPTGYVTDNSDCNDLDSLVNPTSVWYMDMDGDLIGDSTMSFTGCVPPTGYVLAAGDCDDMNAQISGPVTYYSDLDSDSYGDVATAQVLCQNPGAGYVIVAGDCNDNNAQINPAATEICDSIDNDCNGLVDDGLTFVTYFSDADGDGFGTGNGQSLCQNPGSGFVTVGGDCNDNDDQINASALEICDSIDNDCDGNIDEGLNFVTFYTDADNDGFGTGTALSLCQNPGPGFSTNNQDCNDNNNQINPNATETLNNGIDENCDGVDGYLGIEELADLKVLISPNPNQGTFTLQLTENVNNCEIKLLDLSGKQINKYHFSGNKIQIAETGIEKGVYLIHLSINGNSMVERIIIQ